MVPAWEDTTKGTFMRLVGVRLSEASETLVAVLTTKDGVDAARILTDVATFWDSPAAALASFSGEGGTIIPLDQIELVPPVLPGARIICVGLNYLNHVREGSYKDLDLPEYPHPVRALAGIAHGERSGHPRAGRRGRARLGGRDRRCRGAAAVPTPTRTRRVPPSSAMPRSTTCPPGARRSSPRSGRSARTPTTPVRSEIW